MGEHGRPENRHRLTGPGRDYWFNVLKEFSTDGFIGLTNKPTVRRTHDQR
jgi:hypothetical protein